MQQNYYFIYLRYLDLFRCIERCIEANFVKTDWWDLPTLPDVEIVCLGSFSLQCAASSVVCQWFAFFIVCWMLKCRSLRVR